jgi:hypothetical protein
MRTSDDVRQRVTTTYATLDPVQLLRTIRAVQQDVIADRPVLAEATAPTPATLEQFLSGLRTAWGEGEVRPTSKQKRRI